MKAYVTPVENICNARCFFCITMFKKEKEFGVFLPIESLPKLNELTDIDRLEITGGGEPLLHPGIDNIVKEACQFLPTTLYTNGKLISRLSDEALRSLDLLTISRHHYNDERNSLIMGTDCCESLVREAVGRGAKVRLTAVLCSRGMNSAEDIWTYILAARKLGVSQIQIRQFFDYEYGEVKADFVRTAPILTQLLKKFPKLIYRQEKYPTIYYQGLKIEFEGDKCACEAGVPNLRGDGRLYFGWTKLPLPKRFYKQ